MIKINKHYNIRAIAYDDGGGGGSYTLNSKYTNTVADTEKLETLAKALREKHTALSTNVANLYDKIDKMPSEGAWDGQVYAQFRDKAYSYKDGLEGFVLLIDAYAAIIDKINEYVTSTLDPAFKKHSGGA